MANLYRSVLDSGVVIQPTGDAVAANVLAGKTFSNASGIDKVGTMPNRGAVSQTIGAGQSYTIPDGYHNGNGVVNCNAPVLQDTVVKFGVTYHDGGSQARTSMEIPNIGYKHATLTQQVGTVALNGTTISLNEPIDISNVSTLTFNQWQPHDTGIPLNIILLSVT